jgi:hypothetical protein
MTTPADFTPRCRQFLAELDALCARHGVHITPSGYDTLQIWPVHVEDTGGFDLAAIEDGTHEEEQPDAPG